MEDLEAQRDPLRASSTRLRASWLASSPEGLKLTKRERELHAFLELHPGTHNLEQLEASVKGASQAARSLARRNLIALEPEAPTGVFHTDPPPRTLNPHQLEAYQQIEAALRGGKFQAFLLEGVTGSGKTEVYLKAIDACHSPGPSALLLVPEIALTPAMAGQFFPRFGDRVAILHSAFHDAERAEQWRRIRSGIATVVVGTRSGVFAPVRNLGLVVVDEEHDGSYKQQETPRYNGRDVAIVRAQAAGACVVLGSATPSLESRYNAERGKYTLLELPGTHRAAAHAGRRSDRHAAGVSGDAQAGDIFAQLLEAIGGAAGKRRADHACCSTAAAFRASWRAAPAASACSASIARSR